MSTDIGGTFRPMRSKGLVAPLGFAIVLFAGCGDATTSGTLALTASTASKPPGVRIISPHDGRRARAAPMMVRGRATTGSVVMIRVEGDSGAIVRRKAAVVWGRWGRTVPFPTGARSAMIWASLEGTDAFQVIEVQLGPPPESRAHKVLRLLAHKGAIGYTAARLHSELLEPERRQDISGQIMWYYLDDQQMYQVIFSGGTVSAINAY